jgi:hypothetical protein
MNILLKKVMTAAPSLIDSWIVIDPTMVTPSIKSSWFQPLILVHGGQDPIQIVM